MSLGQIFKKKIDFLDKIFSKKTIMFISNKVYRDFKANKARWISPMTKKALGANELLCDNHNNQAKRHGFLTLENDLFMIENVWFTIRFDILKRSSEHVKAIHIMQLFCPWRSV